MIDFKYTDAALTTLYAVANVGTDMVHATTGALQARTSGNWASSAIVLSDALAAYHYVGDLPAGTVPNRHTIRVYLKSGGSPAISDAMVGGPATLDWDGTAEIVGANVTHGNFEPVEPDDTLGDAISNVVIRLGAGTVRIVGNVIGYDLIIRRGDAFNATTGRTLVVIKATGDSWPADLSTWVISFYAAKKSGNKNHGDATAGPVVCAHVTDTGDDQAFRIDLTAAQTTDLAEGYWTWEAKAVKGSDVNTIAGGNLNVLPELPQD